MRKFNPNEQKTETCATITCHFEFYFQICMIEQAESSRNRAVERSKDIHRIYHVTLSFSHQT